jgi:hypothetical protein
MFKNKEKKSEPILKPLIETVKVKEIENIKGVRTIVSHNG